MLTSSKYEKNLPHSPFVLVCDPIVNDFPLSFNEVLDPFNDCLNSDNSYPCTSFEPSKLTDFPCLDLSPQKPTLNKLQKNCNFNDECCSNDYIPEGRRCKGLDSLEDSIKPESSQEASSNPARELDKDSLKPKLEPLPKSASKIGEILQKRPLMAPTAGKRLYPQSLPYLEPIQVNHIIVIHPGSQNLRIGRASDSLPVSIPHCIARRHKVPGQKRYEDPWLVKKECQHAEAKLQQRRGLKQAEEALLSWPNNLGEYRSATSQKQLATYNSCVLGEWTDTHSSLNWTSTIDKPEFLIGEEALYVRTTDCYNLHWPIRYSQLNIHKGPGGTFSSVLADLETIWATALETKLGIPRKDLSDYRVVLLIPDVYIHKHVKALMNILLNNLGFSAAIIHQESVCATFGAGVSSACVLDVGDQKTSVCCVEDGLSHRNTRIVMDYGGSDITRCFQWLLTKSGFNPQHLKITDIVDTRLIQEFKETYCHMDQQQDGVYEYNIHIKKPQSLIIKYNSVKLGDECVLAPLSLFFNDMLALQGSQLCHTQQRYEGDSDDPHDDFYLLQTQSQQQQAARLNAARKKENVEASLNQLDTSFSQYEDTNLSHPQLVDEDSYDGPDNFSGNDTYKGERKLDLEEEEPQDTGPLLQLMGIDQAILHSINKLSNDEIKKKMYSCILVIGGGLNIRGVQGWIQHRLWSQMPVQFRYTLEGMDVITRAKDMEPNLIPWKGASVLSCLDTTQELWIRQKEWQQWSVRILRERAPFIW
ncbi:actin-related protein 8 [Octopus bimaculoides]|nr:actin-related protein 8 [Octopus bimaculoides]